MVHIILCDAGGQEQSDRVKDFVASQVLIVLLGGVHDRVQGQSAVD
jgi:hypothetical protein